MQKGKQDLVINVEVGSGRSLFLIMCRVILPVVSLETDALLAQHRTVVHIDH